MHFPIIVAALLLVFYFAVAMRWGVTRLLSSGFAIAAGLAVFFAGLNLGPPHLEDRFGFEITWEFFLVGAGVLGAIVYFFVWVIAGWIFRAIFSRDSAFHYFGDGVWGGIQAIFPALVMIFVLFNAVRIVGTLHELNYVGTIAQPEIATADLNQLPEVSRFTRWRNQIERLPRVADLLDRCDPFSRRENRNMGVVSLFAATEPSRSFSESSDQLGGLLKNEKVRAWVDSRVMASQLRLNERVGLVLGRQAMEVASQPELKKPLMEIEIDQHVDEFVRYLKTNKTPVSLEN